MSQTVIGVYDNSTEAQQVRDELLRQGFDDDEVSVRYGSAAAEAADEEASGGIVGFFKSLFGDDEDERYASRYHEVITGGRAMVTVRVDTDEGVEEAHSIMNRYNPIDIDVQSARTDDALARGASAATGVQPLSGSTGERGMPVVEEALPVGERMATPEGARVFSRIDERPIEERPEQGGSDYDSDYRRDWQSRHAGSGGAYEEYEPAYRYGANLRGDARYRSREWAAIEPDVRRDWEVREPGTWEKIKDSVRYGWERVKSAV